MSRISWRSPRIDASRAVPRAIDAAMIPISSVLTYTSLGALVFPRVSYRSTGLVSREVGVTDAVLPMTTERLSLPLQELAPDARSH